MPLFHLYIYGLNVMNSKVSFIEKKVLLTTHLNAETKRNELKRSYHNETKRITHNETKRKRQGFRLTVLLAMTQLTK